METSPRVRVGKNNRFDINVRAVWGSMATGNGASHLNEMMATMNVPGMRPNTFSAIEHEISHWWKCVLDDDIWKAGAEERFKAMEEGRYHEGVSAIRVITDGGWSKRTNKYTYNALGGVAIIIGENR